MRSFYWITSEKYFDVRRIKYTYPKIHILKQSFPVFKYANSYIEKPAKRLIENSTTAVHFIFRRMNEEAQVGGPSWIFSRQISSPSSAYTEPNIHRSSLRSNPYAEPDIDGYIDPIYNSHSPHDDGYMNPVHQHISTTNDGYIETINQHGESSADDELEQINQSVSPTDDGYIEPISQLDSPSAVGYIEPISQRDLPSADGYIEPISQRDSPNADCYIEPISQRASTGDDGYIEPINQRASTGDTCSHAVSYNLNVSPNSRVTSILNKYPDAANPSMLDSRIAFDHVNIYCTINDAELVLLDSCNDDHLRSDCSASETCNPNPNSNQTSPSVEIATEEKEEETAVKRPLHHAYEVLGERFRTIYERLDLQEEETEIITGNLWKLSQHVLHD